jgi:SHAQKYF class myb-like DNA-binding protein
MRDSSRESSQGANVRHNCAWTDNEHRLFLLGLAEHGRGAWRAIASDYVTTRTATQVRNCRQPDFREALDSPHFLFHDVSRSIETSDSH